MLTTPRIRRTGLGLALVVVTLFSAAAPGGMANAGGTDIATLLVLAGGATVNGASAADGQTLQVGDDIWTAMDGIALVTFFDGSETQLQASTHITLEVPDGTVPGTGVSVFQSAGTTLTHVQPLAANASFQTETPAAVALVRGTTYVVTTTPEAQAAADSNAPSSCERDKPAECAASVLLLADSDGHVGHVEVASHIAGHPTLHLTTHGGAAHVSRAGAQQRVVAAEHLKHLHDAAAHLHDAQRASRAHAAARRVAHAGLARARRAASSHDR